MRREERARHVLGVLSRRYGASFDENPGTTLSEVRVKTRDPYKVLISTILSHRTKDERTAEASRQLFRVYDTPEEIANAPIRALVPLLRPVGFYRQKARQIRTVSRVLLDRHDGIVPRTYDALVDLPQVGPKTANCVLVYGFGEPAIPVDVHVAVVSRRLGLAPADADEVEVERSLRRAVPRESWLQVNEFFVRFGKETCRTAAPRCDECPFTASCRHYRARDGASTRSTRTRGGRTRR